MRYLGVVPFPNHSFAIEGRVRFVSDRFEVLSDADQVHFTAEELAESRVEMVRAPQGGIPAGRVESLCVFRATLASDFSKVRLEPAFSGGPPLRTISRR